MVDPWLKASIEAWMVKLAAEFVDEIRMGNEGCPLCSKYLSEGAPRDNCVGCPIRQKTGKAFCVDTPYSAAAHAYLAWKAQPGYGVMKARFRQAASEQTKFMEGLANEQQSDDAGEPARQA